ncbi:uncharacterized protein LOC143576476 [Bidens hawaiensis]|uniref:uncharacterized protein LOC143576476 n=1 Tax=Bidens hawaiensis TaxID=980011 RepID=UPI00404ADA0B
MKQQKMLQEDENASDGSESAIVIPPPDIKEEVDSAARFLASIRPEYEKPIIDQGASTCSFLNVADPYHAYFQHRLSQFRAQNASANQKPSPKLPIIASGNTTDNPWFTEVVKIRAQWLAAAPKLVSPITGEPVPVHKMSEHMHTCVTDPKYKEQKESLFREIREATLAQDDRISKTIVWLARTRPDIFGTTQEEFSSAVKAEIAYTI